MTVQITIIGLGQVGSSIGLALAGQPNIKRIGHDKNYETGRLGGSRIEYYRPFLKVLDDIAQRFPYFT